MPGFAKCPVDRVSLDYSLENGGTYQCPGCGFEFKCEYECSGRGEKNRCDVCFEIVKNEAKKYFKFLLEEYTNRKGDLADTELSSFVLRKRLLSIKNNIHRKHVKLEFDEGEVERLMNVN